MAKGTMDDLLTAQLRDAYSAETQLVKAMPKMAKAASNPVLKQAFEAHLKETEGQVERLEQIGKKLDIKLTGDTCEATRGLIEEGEEAIAMDVEDEVRDAALVISAQKVEHYEIALYGGLCAVAKRLMMNDIAATLHETLEEEKATDLKLTKLAETLINPQAAAVGR